jgi:hypothetical protein
MKPIIIIFLSLLFCANINAQELTKIPELDQLEGTWQWKSRDSVLTIIFIKSICSLKKMRTDYPDLSSEVLIGWHEFSVGGKVLQSSLSMKSIEFDHQFRKQTIYASFVRDGRLNVNRFRDIQTDAEIQGSFEYDTNAKNAILKLDKRAPSDPSESKRDSGYRFSLPTMYNLTKIE